MLYFNFNFLVQMVYKAIQNHFAYTEEFNYIYADDAQQMEELHSFKPSTNC